MYKRLLSMVLAVVMLMSVVALVGCGKDKDLMDKELLDVETISMWIVSEKEVSAETEKLVEEAFSAITVSKYKVYVDLSFYTEDEYFTRLESKLSQLKEDQAIIDEMNDLISDALMSGGKLTEEEIVENFFAENPEYEFYREHYVGYKSDEPEELQTEIVDGMSKPVYPKADENQVDIIYIAGRDKYISYIENEWLAPLDEELAGVAAKLTTYVSTPLLTGTKVKGETYAIPNNNEIGKYTYMLLDKEICDKYYFDYTKVTSIIDCQSLVEDIMIHENKGLTSEDDGYVLPIASTFDECLDMLVWYWNIDIETVTKEVFDEDGYAILDDDGNPLKVTSSKYTINRDNKFNLVGCLYGSPLNVNRGDITLGFNSLFGDAQYKSVLLALKKYQFDNCYGEAREGQNSAISFIEGDYSVKKGWTDSERGVYTDENGKQYYAVVVKYPQADENDIFGNMFAVSAFSSHLTESMEVITELNTSKELKNILQYGIEGTHYVIEKGSLRRLNNDYMMDMDVTGNCFVAYPEEGKPADYWEGVRRQNSEALIDPLLGLDFNELLESYTDNPEKPASFNNDMIRDIASMSDSIWAELEACTTYKEYAGLINGPTGSATITPIVDRLKFDAETTVKFGNKVIDFYKYCSGTSKPSNEGEAYYPYTVYLQWSAKIK